MSDELTPREKELLAKLPRERMPLGLEGRVVEAMREKGFLARRRRMIEITNSRVAGLLAACVALMIGAYAIGLHRGGGDVVLTVPTIEREARVGAPPADFEGKKTPTSGDVAETEEESPTRGRHDEERPVAARSDASVPVESAPKAEPSQQNVAKSKAQSTVEPAPGAVAETAEETAGDAPQAEERARSLASGKEAPATPPKKALKTHADESSERIADTGGREEAQPAVEARPSARAQGSRRGEVPAVTTSPWDDAREAEAESVTEKALPLPQSIRDDLADRRLTLLLNGTPVTVEADSARVVEDERGRILIIYTPDGIMRLRLAD
jgi:hypothetical protein